MEYWIWLQRALGAGARADEIISFFGSPREFYEAGRREWILSGVVSSDTAERIAGRSPGESADIIRECEKNNWSIITPQSKYYPEALGTISSYPLVLYVWGDPGVLKEKLMISFVGTREASRYGLSVSRRLAYDVAGAGAVVVSGGALGIDSSSHEGALAAGGKTIAFLGCGLGFDYLRENLALRREIAGNGAVVSEFPPDSPPTKSSFPIRNRLISGISLGTVIIEAGIKSGSLITARCAAQQGRDVFAVPGDIISSNYTGANKLIKDGAKPVFSAADILEEYAYLFPGLLKALSESKPKTKAPEIVKPEINYSDEDKKEKKPFVKKAPDFPLSEETQGVYDRLNNIPKTADDIAEECGLPIMGVLAALTELEMFGLAAQGEGKLFAAREI